MGAPLPPFFPPSTARGWQRHAAAPHARARARRDRAGQARCVPPTLHPCHRWGKAAPRDRTMCAVACASRSRKADTMRAARAPLSPPPATAWGGQRRATTPRASPHARRDRARQTRCVQLALSLPLQPPLGEGIPARQHHECHRVRVAIARDRQDACRSPSASAFPPPPHPPLGEGSAAVPHHVRRRGRVTVARDRREACRSYSASHPCGHRWGRAVRGSSTVSAVQPCLLGGQAAPNDVLTRTAHAAVTLSGAGNVCGDPQAIRRDVRALVLRALRSANARRRTTSPCCGSSPRQQAASEPASMPSIIPGRPGPTSSPGRAARASGPTPRARTSAVSPGYANARHSRVPRPMRAHSVAPDVPPPPRGAAPGHGPAEPGRVCCAA